MEEDAKREQTNEEMELKNEEMSAMAAGIFEFKIDRRSLLDDVYNETDFWYVYRLIKAVRMLVDTKPSVVTNMAKEKVAIVDDIVEFVHFMRNYDSQQCAHVHSTRPGNRLIGTFDVRAGAHAYTNASSVLVLITIDNKDVLERPMGVIELDHTAGYRHRIVYVKSFVPHDPVFTD